MALARHSPAMTFPDQNFDNITAFSRAYFHQMSRAVASVDDAKLQEAAGILSVAFDQRASIYVCGNGGSAAISNHFICDHLKGVQTDTKVLPRIISLLSIYFRIYIVYTFSHLFLPLAKSVYSISFIYLDIIFSGFSTNTHLLLY